MEGADTCCGSGGSFTLQHYDLSKRIGRRKRDTIVATGAKVVATSCPACMTAYCRFRLPLSLRIRPNRRR